MKNNKINLLHKYILNKNVLEFGLGNYHPKDENNFVYQLNKFSKNYTGIELNEKRAKSFQKKNINVVCGNAETKKLNKKFDTLIADNFIEHIDNPGIFLENCKSHMKNGSYLILSTPNAFSINRLITGLLRFGNLPQYKEHVFLFTPQLLMELLRRKKYKIISYNFYNSDSNNIKGYFIKYFSKISKYFSEYFVIIAKLK
tara:strand:- start:1892 stop:2491 length:600 start_codon:yes stop_codon:yes gene_type:complete